MRKQLSTANRRPVPVSSATQENLPAMTMVVQHSTLQQMQGFFDGMSFDANGQPNAASQANWSLFQNAYSQVAGEAGLYQFTGTDASNRALWEAVIGHSLTSAEWTAFRQQGQVQYVSLFDDLGGNSARNSFAFMVYQNNVLGGFDLAARATNFGDNFWGDGVSRDGKGERVTYTVDKRSTRTAIAQHTCAARNSHFALRNKT